MNPLDAAISQGRKLPSKNKKGSVPPDYDVVMPGMGAKKPGKKVINSKRGKPAPMPKKPSNMGTTKKIIKPGKKK